MRKKGWAYRQSVAVKSSKSCKFVFDSDLLLDVSSEGTGWEDLALTAGGIRARRKRTGGGF